MPAAQWIKVCAETDLAEGTMRVVRPRGISVLLARVNGALYALSDACAHMACPLHRGSLAGYVLTCPCHDWRFDVRDGSMLDAPEIKLAVYPLICENGSVLVQLKEEA